MEALYMQPFEEKALMLEDQGQDKSREQKEGGMDASDAETDEDSEPEPPLVIRRKVSFADAFGLNLVSVKEFDNADVTESEVNQDPVSEATHPLEEFYISCLFAVPSCSEELDQRLQAQMVELESIELLPGTSMLRGIIRVVNLCFDKSVYARMTLDRWTSYFDLLAEYVPGSSDRKTDRFTFKYTLIPPFEKDGTRLEFCLRYETSEGTFWANNNQTNYVLFCHQRGHVREQRPQVQEESCTYRSKRSCLKANRRGSTQEKALETSYTSTVIAEGEAAHKARKAPIKTKESAEIKSVLCHEEHKLLVDSIKSRQRATRLARVQEQLAKRRQQVPTAHSHDSAKGQELCQPLTPTLVDAAGFPHGRQKKPSNQSPQVLTYHQIPLLTLDWNNDKIQQWGSADIDDIWTGSTKVPLLKASAENMEVTPSNNDMWETFTSGTDDTTDKGSSASDEWQSFLKRTSCTDHIDVPESEWLQTATSVSPSKAQHVSSSQTHEFQVGTDPPTNFNSHTSAACQMLSNSRQKSLASVALNMDDHQPAEACVSSPRNENTTTQDASQRSQTNLVTDTLQEFSLKGVTPVSEGRVDGLTECHEHAVGERERDGIIGGAEGIERDEPHAEHTADLVTGSGESVTTGLIEMPESQNASAVDRISQGARLDVGLSSSRESEVTGTAHNAMDDMLAFQGNIKQGTKHGERFVFPTSRQEEEKGIMNNCTANRVSAVVQVFRPQKTEGCKISQRYADEKHREEFRLNQNSENPLQENESDEIQIRPAQSDLDQFNPNQTCEDNFKESQMREGQFRLDKIENLEVDKLTGMETTFCTSCGGTERLMGAEAEIIKVLNEESCQYKALQLNPSRQGDNTFIISVHEKQSRPIQATKELCYQENGLDSKTGEHALVSNRKEEGTSLRCHGIIEEQQEKNTSAQTRHTLEQSDMMMGFQRDHDSLRSFSTDKCNPNALEVSEKKWNHLQGDMKGQKEDVGNETKTEQVTAKETVGKADSSAELQHQPELLEIIAGDMSQRDKDERGSIGKLEIEAQGELMGNEENPQGERKNAPAILEEQELSAEVESSPHVECKKLSEETKEPIKAESTKTFEAMESELEETSVERFGEDLVKRIWEEVFGERVQACKRDTDITNGTGGKSADIPDSPQICHLLLDKDSNNAFDSGVFSLIELPMDPSVSISQDLEQTLVLESNEFSSKEGSQSLSETEQTYFLWRDSEAPTDLTLSAHLSQDLNPILVANSQQSLTEPAQSPPKDNENYTQMKDRAVVYKETVRQTEDSRVTSKASFNQSSHQSHRVPQKLKESDLLVWWSMLYILSHHITRLVVCAFLVAGFFVIVFLCDFPVFLALYIFSMCYLFSQWKRHQVTTNKGIVG